MHAFENLADSNCDVVTVAAIIMVINNCNQMHLLYLFDLPSITRVYALCEVPVQHCVL